MLEHAAKHEAALKVLFMDIADDIHFQYLWTESFRNEYQAYHDTWSARDMVSIQDGQVLGHLRYLIDRDANVAYALSIVNFTREPNVTFSKDLYQFLRDIFEKFQYRKLRFGTAADNPILPTYRRLCHHLGGREVGYYEKDDKLLDGEYHDYILFEVMRDNYLATRYLRKRSVPHAEL